RTQAKDSDADDPKTHARAHDVPCDLTQRAQWRISGPAANWSNCATSSAKRRLAQLTKPCADCLITLRKDGRQQNQEANQRHPELHQVEECKGHVFGANLDREEVVSKAALWRSAEYEEDHDRSVHGD